MKKSMILVFAISLILLSGCQDNKTIEDGITIDDSVQDNNIEEVTAYVEFEFGYSGALKNMMHKGDLSAKTSLSEYAKKKYIYALGAIENLKGEVMILNGKPYNTNVNGEELEFDNTFDSKACLFVYAIVEDWKTFEIPEEINTYENLEIFVEMTAKNSNINTSEPFPFMLEGTAKSFDWHVINWKDGDTEHSHEKHVQSGLFGTIENRAVEMLGFYSDSHHAIFTHHTTNMHIHVKTKDDKLAGHVDGMTLGKGMILKLPK